MKKPTIYLETSAISAYWYEGADVAMLARRLHTREWWDLERQHFELWSSAFGESELLAGNYRRQDECLKMIRRMRYLVATSEARQLQREIIRTGLVPLEKAADAAHLAICAAHKIDFLLTWNYAHMANPVVQARFEKLCRDWNVTAPLMVSTEMIPQVRFGQSVRRD